MSPGEKKTLRSKGHPGRHASRCPFYGASMPLPDFCAADEMLQPSPNLIITGGNRCALITSAHSPCVMEISGDSPRWTLCRRNPEVNGIYVPPAFAGDLPQ